MIEITINGKKVSCQPGMSVAAALMNAGIVHFRESVSGENRGPLCGMGVCFECRVTINRIAGQRGCTTLLEREMDIETSESDPCTDEHR